MNAMPLCDLGASVSTIPKTLCDLLGFRDFDDCSLNLHLADSTIKKPMGRINDVLIVANSNYVPIDFIVLDIDYYRLFCFDRFYFCVLFAYFDESMASIGGYEP